MFSDNYYHLFTLHAVMTNAIIPPVHGLLIGKSVHGYNLFVKRVLKQDNFQPESVMTDFKTGTIKYVREKPSSILDKATTSAIHKN